MYMAQNSLTFCFLVNLFLSSFYLSYWCSIKRYFTFVATILCHGIGLACQLLCQYPSNSYFTCFQHYPTQRHELEMLTFITSQVDQSTPNIFNRFTICAQDIPVRDILLCVSWRELSQRDSNAQSTKPTDACYIWMAKPLWAALEPQKSAQLMSQSHKNGLVAWAELQAGWAKPWQHY